MPTEKNPDTVLFVRCAEWREARAKHELVLAQNRKASARPRYRFTDVEAYLDMKNIESILARDAVPATIAGAEELLRVVATILAHPNKDDVGMGEGPVLEIVKGVADGLQSMS